MEQLFEAEVSAVWPLPVSSKADLGNCSLMRAVYLKSSEYQEALTVLLTLKPIKHPCSS